MAAPRRDPDTRPVAARFTLELDTRDGAAPRSGPRRSGRPVQIRNGIPEVPRYRYRGTGQDTDPETSTWTDRRRAAA